MIEIKKYSPALNMDGDSSYVIKVDMRESNHGEYVKYEDIEEYLLFFEDSQRESL
jgi:hypothetical protein